MSSFISSRLCQVGSLAVRVGVSSGNSNFVFKNKLLSSVPTIHQGIRLRTFKACVLREFGKPLVVDDLKDGAKLKKDQVRIKVHACGVNNSDILMCKGEYGIQPKLPIVPGFEVAGEIMEIGKEVNDFHVGDRVVAINKEFQGGFGEQCVAPLKDVWSLPPEIDYIRAASLIDSYVTAYLGLVRRADIQPEDTILVTAAAGGLGLAAVDLAAHVYQAKVIGVCGTEDKASLVREMGAFAALSYTRKGMMKTVNDVTNGKGVRVVFDAVGGELFLDCLDCVAHEGKVIVAGFASRKIPQISTDLLLPKSFSLIGVSLTHYRDANPEVYREAIQDVIQMEADGDLTPHVSATYPLEKVNEAFQFVEERKSTGKVVITI